MSQSPVTPFSYHIFLFPFKWDYYKRIENRDDLSFIERTKLKDIEGILRGIDQWRKFKFNFEVDEISQYNNYNEYAYFHDFVRSTMSLRHNDEVGVLQYNYQISDQAQYLIKLKDQEEPYQLELNEIILNFYDVGVGYMSFHLENSHYKEAEDILKINDYGRRIFPPFLGTKSPLTSDPKEYSSLPDWIEIKGVVPVRNAQVIKEDFSYYDELCFIKGEPVHLPKFVSLLLSENFITNASNFRSPKPHVVFQPVIDDRMFVMSYYFNNKKLGKLKKYSKADGQYRLERDDFWYAYLFVDSPSPSVASKRMKKELLLHNTYDRWINFKNQKTNNQEGHLFGISRYSFVLLADDCFFTRKILPNHFSNVYFQMIALALVQRATILRFSGEASRIVSLLKKQTKDPSSKIISELYLEYIYFVNKIHHREITPQEQGIELYRMLQDIMDIDRNVKFLDQEIEELNRYAMMIEEEKRSKEAENLTKIATWFLPPTLIAGVLGMNTFPILADSGWYCFWVSIFILIILSAFGIWVINYIINNKRNGRK